METTRVKIMEIKPFGELYKETRAKVLERYRHHLVSGQWWGHCYEQWEQRGIILNIDNSIKNLINEFDSFPRENKFLTFKIDPMYKLYEVASILVRDFSRERPIHRVAELYKANDYGFENLDQVKTNFATEQLFAEIYKEVLNQLENEYRYLTYDETLENTFEEEDWLFNCNGIKQEFEQKIYEVHSKRFLDWYFFNNDTENLVHGIVDDIFEKGKASITVQEIFDNCEYVPISLVLDNLTKEDAQYGKQLRVNKDIILKLKEDDKSQN